MADEETTGQSTDKPGDSTTETDSANSEPGTDAQSDSTAPEAPEKYDWTLSDGSPLDPKADLRVIEDYARKHKMTQEQAAEHLGHLETLARGFVARQQEARAADIERWQSETRSDPELGGTKFDETCQLVKKAVDRFAPEGSKFRDVMNETGIGDNPEFIRVFAAIGRSLKEDSPPTGKPKSPESQTKSKAEKIYPNRVAVNA